MTKNVHGVCTQKCSHGISSGYFNLHSQYGVGIPHFALSRCSQAFRFLSTFETISQACLDVYFYFPYASVFSYVYWLFQGFSSVICLFVAFVLCSVRLFAFCCYSCFNSSSVTCIADIVSCSLACLFTLCFRCLLCFKKCLPTSKNHKNGLPCFSSSFLNLIFKFTALISWNSFLSMLWVTILVFHMNGAFCTIYQIDHLNSNAVL